MRRAILVICAAILSITSTRAATFSFPDSRGAYRLDLTPAGTAVTNVSSGASMTVPFGDAMSFRGDVKYSKNTWDALHYVGSHLEAYEEWQRLVDLPIDFLRTGAYWNFIGAPHMWGPDQLSGRPPILPDRPGKIIVGYVNAAEFTAIGQWDPAFDPSWDRNGDAIIDDGVSVPAYVDRKAFNAPWKNYVAAYWTESWRNQLARKIDVLAAEHFDGVMLDVMTGYQTWAEAYPSMHVGRLQADTADLFRWVSAYAKQRYGTAFVVTANIDLSAYQYFPDMGRHLDGGYYQNALFEWTGSGQVVGQGRSASTDKFTNPSIQFLVEQGVAILNMDHLGTGPVPAGLSFTNYDDRVTTANLLILMEWAIASGSTPYCAPVFFGSPFSIVPRFVRTHPGRGSNTNSSFADWVIGSSADDTVDTGAGDDLVFGGAGNDRIDGGAGTNSVLYLGPRSNFDIVSDASGTTIADRTGSEGTDRLIGIQRLLFSDTSIALGRE